MGLELSRQFNKFGLASEEALEIGFIFDDFSEMEVGEHYKLGLMYATKELYVSDEVVEEFGVLSKLRNHMLVQQGTWSDTWGWESCDAIELMEPKIKHVPEQYIPAHDEVVWVMA